MKDNMSKCIFTYTAPFSGSPECIKVTTHENGSTIVAVSTQGDELSSVVNLPPDQVIALAKALLASQQ